MMLEARGGTVLTHEARPRPPGTTVARQGRTTLNGAWQHSASSAMALTRQYGPETSLEEEEIKGIKNKMLCVPHCLRKRGLILRG